MKSRGLWIFLLYPVWVFIWGVTGTFFKIALETTFNAPSTLSWIGYIGGFTFTVYWYRWDFTRNHPILSSIVSTFSVTVLTSLLVNHVFLR